MRLEFFLPMIPPTITHRGERIRVIERGGKHIPIVYEPEELKAARAKLTAHIGPWTPERPLKGPVRLITKWCWPTEGKVPSGTYIDVKPDTDNVIKLPKDIMNDLGFFAVDDAQVASEITEKFWADPAGIYIAIEELVS